MLSTFATWNVSMQALDDRAWRTTETRWKHDDPTVRSAPLPDLPKQPQVISLTDAFPETAA
jgi:hypothetical protein